MVLIINNLVSMGYIKSVYGVKGWVDIKTNDQTVNSLANYSTWYLYKDNIIKQFEVLDSKVISNTLKVKFNGIEDRTQAYLLLGMEIKIPREKFKLLDKDEYYWVDLIGMEIKNLQNIFLGKVKNLISAGVHDVLVIEGLEKEILIPFVSRYVIDINLNDKKIICDWESYF